MKHEIHRHWKPIAALAVVVFAVLGFLAYRWHNTTHYTDERIRPANIAAESAPSVIAAAGSLHLAVEALATGLTRPVGIVVLADGQLAVLEKAGRVRVVAAGQVLPTPFLDVSTLVDSDDDEDGLIGMALHPGYTSNGRVFIAYTSHKSTVRIVEYHASGFRAEPASARILLEYKVDELFHLGGTLAFGPDGYLYISTGDGGPQADANHVAQDLPSLRGKVLRIDVDHAQPYAIPPDNPYASAGPTDRPEVFLRGFRNPWRMSFDGKTADLWLPDVGQDAWEEVNVVPAPLAGGGNFGWSIMEGTYCFRKPDCIDRGFTSPLFSYSHNAGCAIIGGYVYRGDAIPALQGKYVFSDYCDGGIYALSRDGDGWTAERVGDTNGRPSSFGRDNAGELYVAGDRDGTVYRLVHAENR